MRCGLFTELANFTAARGRRQVVVVVRPGQVAQLGRAARGQRFTRERVGTGQVGDDLADRHRRARRCRRRSASAPRWEATCG